MFDDVRLPNGVSNLTFAAHPACEFPFRCYDRAMCAVMICRFVSMYPSPRKRPYKVGRLAGTYSNSQWIENVDLSNVRTGVRA